MKKHPTVEKLTGLHATLLDKANSFFISRHRGISHESRPLYEAMVEIAITISAACLFFALLYQALGLTWGP